MSNETKPTNNNEHVDGVTNSVQQRELNISDHEERAKKKVQEKLENQEKLRKKFWELQEKQSSKEPFLQEFFTGATYCEGIDSDWNNFVCGVDKSLELTLLIFSEDNKSGQKINCHKWVFPFAVEIRGIFGKIAFTESVFENGLSTTDSFEGGVNFSQSKFIKGASFNGKLLEEANFMYAEFFGYANFVGVDFESVARFELCTFVDCNMYFLESSFLKNTHFNSVDVRGKTNFRFEYCQFHGLFNFNTRHKPEEGSEITSISLVGSEFLKTAIFTQEKSGDFKPLVVGIIDAAGAIFREPLVIRFLNLKNPPDLSRAYFLDTKKLSLTEGSWEDNGKIDERKVFSNDEPKFRFLKKYFAEQGNHFKEQEYFSYEMMARKELLRSKVFSWSEMKKDFYGWLKNLSEFVLFFAYKLTSNFGMSWIRPLICLLVSAFVMQQYIKEPVQNYFGFWNEFFVFRIEGISFWEALLKTISPLSTVEEFKDSLPVKVHSSFNVLLIFLLGLGLRNKFKVKSK